MILQHGQVARRGVHIPKSRVQFPVLQIFHFPARYRGTYRNRESGGNGPMRPVILSSLVHSCQSTGRTEFPLTHRSEGRRFTASAEVGGSSPSSREIGISSVWLERRTLSSGISVTWQRARLGSVGSRFKSCIPDHFRGRRPTAGLGASNAAMRVQIPPTAPP